MASVVEGVKRGLGRLANRSLAEPPPTWVFCKSQGFPGGLPQIHPVLMHRESHKLRINPYKGTPPSSVLETMIVEKPTGRQKEEEAVPVFFSPLPSPVVRW